MYYIPFCVTHRHYSGSELIDHTDQKSVAVFDSLQDAIHWAGFYQNRVDDATIQEYSRDWSVGSINLACNPVTVRPTDIPDGFTATKSGGFIYDREIPQCHMSWDVIDALPLNDPDYDSH